MLEKIKQSNNFIAALIHFTAHGTTALTFWNDLPVMSHLHHCWRFSDGALP